MIQEKPITSEQLEQAMGVLLDLIDRMKPNPGTTMVIECQPVFDAICTVGFAIKQTNLIKQMKGQK